VLAGNHFKIDILAGIFGFVVIFILWGGQVIVASQMNLVWIRDSMPGRK
jgi:hypothetical protein